MPLIKACGVRPPIEMGSPVRFEVLVDWNIAALVPDVAADWNWADYVAGREPDVEAALGSPLACPK